MLFLHSTIDGVWQAGEVIQLILGILLFVSAIFLIVAVLMQTGKSKGVGSAIGGGSSETYFGKNKGKSRDKKLALLTTIVAIIFVVFALLSFIIQPYEDLDAVSTTTTTTKAPTSANSSTNASVDSSTSASTDALAGGTTDSSTTASTDASTGSSDTTTSADASNSDDVVTE